MKKSRIIDRQTKCFRVNALNFLVSVNAKIKKPQKEQNFISTEIDSNSAQPKRTTIFFYRDSLQDGM